jgi:predicted DNA binding CopG/RHH family protein
MRDEYDFSKAVKNPYAKRMKRQVTLDLSANAVDYFKAMAMDSGIPYQTLISLYLTECAEKKRRISLSWT